MPAWSLPFFSNFLHTKLMLFMICISHKDSIRNRHINLRGKSNLTIYLWRGMYQLILIDPAVYKRGPIHSYVKLCDLLWSPSRWMSKSGFIRMLLLIAIHSLTRVLFHQIRGFLDQGTYGYFLPYFQAVGFCGCSFDILLTLYDIHWYAENCAISQFQHSLSSACSIWQDWGHLRNQETFMEVLFPWTSFLSIQNSLWFIRYQSNTTKSLLT